MSVNWVNSEKQLLEFIWKEAKRRKVTHRDMIDALSVSSATFYRLRRDGGFDVSAILILLSLVEFELLVVPSNPS